MSQVFRCISRWRAAPGKEYEVKVQSMSFDSKGHVILLCSADVKTKDHKDKVSVVQPQTEIKGD